MSDSSVYLVELRKPPEIERGFFQSDARLRFPEFRLSFSVENSACARRTPTVYLVAAIGPAGTDQRRMRTRSQSRPRSRPAEEKGGDNTAAASETAATVRSDGEGRKLGGKLPLGLVAGPGTSESAFGWFNITVAGSVAGSVARAISRAVTRAVALFPITRFVVRPE